MNTQEPIKELITESPDSQAPQLAIATRIFSGRLSKKAKGEGDRSKARTNSKVTHVSLTRMVTKRVRGSRPPEYKAVRIEEEVLAEFEGPTGEDAAREFVRLYQRGASTAKGKCVADGPTPPPSETLDGWRGHLPPHRMN